MTAPSMPQPAKFQDGARTRPITGPSMTEAELDTLVNLRPERSRVRLVPGSLIPGTRYRLGGWLGDGGTGVVYESTHEDLGRKVAVKVLHIEHSQDAEMLVTFREEARAATKIGSPYIVEVIDFGELPDGRLLYVMERLRGTSLDREVSSAPMDPARMISILRQACQGLAAAHDAGLVHRDIKPEHLLILDPREPQAQRRSDRVKIMDFGIAAVLGRQAVDIQGTPSYMAPEQVLGIGVARQNDIYSLGCTAYEMMVGHPPFRGDSLKDVLRKHMREAPVPPSDILGPGVVPRALEAVVLKCLAKKKLDRYPDMRELEAALVEAQIESGIVTDWDDLPLPDIDPERKRDLEERLGRLRATHAPVRRWWVSALAGAAIAGVAVFGVGQLIGSPAPEVVAAEVSRVDEIEHEAKDAAAKANFVYPPAGQPDAPTAYLKVVELESLTGDEKAPAEARAKSLRVEFADTLQRLGDKYWDMEHGRTFAVDYYAQAILFDREHERAKERAGLPLSELAEFRRKADERDFSSVELEAAEPLAVLAIEDHKARKARVKDWVGSRGKRQTSAVAEVRFDALLDEMNEKPPEPPPAVAVASVASLPELPDPVVPAEPQTRRDPRKARESAAEGRAALQKYRLKDASQAFHRALEYDPNCAAAFIGLSDLSFERAQHGDAVKYARKAVNVDPTQAGYRIKYGDALVKVHEYERARKQYERAKVLGSSTADGRLTRLDEWTGRP